MTLHPDDILTYREDQIVLLISRGLTTDEIAKQLKLSLRTIENHRYKIKKKLGVNNSVQIINKMLKLNLMEFIEGEFRKV